MPSACRGELMLGVLRRIDRAEHELAQIAADHRRAVAAHHHDRMAAERARERGALLGLHHQQVGVAELVAAVPERRVPTHRGAEMEHRHERHAGDRERHDRGRMVVAHGIHVGARLEDLAMDHALGIRTRHRRHDRVGVEVVFQDVVRLDQRGRARARQEIALRVLRMAHADVAEGIQNALVGDDAVGGQRVRGAALREYRARGHSFMWRGQQSPSGVPDQPVLPPAQPVVASACRCARCEKVGGEIPVVERAGEHHAADAERDQHHGVVACRASLQVRPEHRDHRLRDLAIGRLDGSRRRARRRTTGRSADRSPRRRRGDRATDRRRPRSARTAGPAGARPARRFCQRAGASLRRKCRTASA